MICSSILTVLIVFQLGRWNVCNNISIKNQKADLKYIGLSRLNQSSRWVGHLQQTTNERNTKKIHQVILHSKRLKLRSKGRRKDDVEHDIRKVGVVNWRQLAQKRERWRKASSEALIIPG